MTFCLERLNESSNMMCTAALAFPVLRLVAAPVRVTTGLALKAIRQAPKVETPRPAANITKQIADQTESAAGLFVVKDGKPVYNYQKILRFWKAYYHVVLETFFILIVICVFDLKDIHLEFAPIPGMISNIIISNGRNKLANGVKTQT